MIPDVPEYSKYFPTCIDMIEEMNGWLCNTPGFGIVLFESLDPDSWDRSIQPVEVRYNEDEATQNILNSYQDHQCDAFYNSQKRMSRFPALVYAGEPGLRYEFYMTGTPPQKMRWKFATPEPEYGLTIKIVYPSA